MTALNRALFTDFVTITDMDVDGQKFHNVSRIVGVSETHKCDVIIDVQSDMYRLKTKEKFTLTLVKTLDLQGKEDDGYWHPKKNEPTLIDRYDYGMYGKIYKCDQLPNNRMAVYVSHGGLLMKIVGEARILKSLEQDSKVYSLLKKSEI